MDDLIECQLIDDFGQKNHYQLPFYISQALPANATVKDYYDAIKFQNKVYISVIMFMILFKFAMFLIY